MTISNLPDFCRQRFFSFSGGRFLPARRRPPWPAHSKFFVQFIRITCRPPWPVSTHFFLRTLNHVPATCRPRWPALHKILRIEIHRIQFRYSDQFLSNCSVSAEVATWSRPLFGLCTEVATWSRPLFGLYRGSDLVSISFRLVQR